VALNIAEGSAKSSLKDRRRFYTIALGSLREVQTIIELESLPIEDSADQLGAYLYRLIQSLGA
jgi:four helix bundle protein